LLVCGVPYIPSLVVEYILYYFIRCAAESLINQTRHVHDISEYCQGIVAEFAVMSMAELFLRIGVFAVCVLREFACELTSS